MFEPCGVTIGSSLLHIHLLLDTPHFCSSDVDSFLQLQKNDTLPFDELKEFSDEQVRAPSVHSACCGFLILI